MWTLFVNNSLFIWWYKTSIQNYFLGKLSLVLSDRLSKLSCLFGALRSYGFEYWKWMPELHMKSLECQTGKVSEFYKQLEAPVGFWALGLALWRKAEGRLVQVKREIKIQMWTLELLSLHRLTGKQTSGWYKQVVGSFSSLSCPSIGYDGIRRGCGPGRPKS